MPIATLEVGPSSSLIVADVCTRFLQEFCRGFLFPGQTPKAGRPQNFGLCLERYKA